MPRSFALLAVMVAALALGSTAGGLIFSRAYWGYWMMPPSVLPWLQELAVVDSISAIRCEPGVPVTVAPIASSDIPKLAQVYEESPADAPNERAFAALVEANILTVPATVNLPDAQAICDATQASAFIVAADPGYPYGRRISAVLVLGQTSSRDRVGILSAKGGELSNDHYGLYDVRFVEGQPSRWRPSSHHVYFEDIAGIEGARWWFASLVLFVAGALLLLAVSVLSALVSGRGRLNTNP